MWFELHAANFQDGLRRYGPRGTEASLSTYFMTWSAPPMRDRRVRRLSGGGEWRVTRAGGGLASVEAWRTNPEIDLCSLYVKRLALKVWMKERNRVDQVRCLFGPTHICLGNVVSDVSPPRSDLPLFLRKQFRVVFDAENSYTFRRALKQRVEIMEWNELLVVVVGI